MGYCLIFVPVLGALSCGLMVYGGYQLLFSSFLLSWRTRKLNDITANLLKEGKLKEKLLEKFNQMDLLVQVAPMLDKHLDKFIVGIQKQIPMAAMFLGPPLVDKLKGIAKAEILKLIPELQRKLGDNIAQKIDVNEFISSRLAEMDWDSIKVHLWPAVLQATLAAALFGMLIGFLQLLIMRFCVG